MTDDTPRTDDMASDGWGGDAWCVPVMFAEMLEKELAESNRKLAEVEERLNFGVCIYCREKFSKREPDFLENLAAHITTCKESPLVQTIAQLRTALEHYKNHPAPHRTPLAELEADKRRLDWLLALIMDKGTNGLQSFLWTNPADNDPMEENDVILDRAAIDRAMTPQPAAPEAMKAKADA